MKVNYKGYEITVKKNKYFNNMNTFYSICDKNGFQVITNFDISSDTIRNYIKKLKQYVDEIIKENKSKKDRHDIIIKKLKLYANKCDDKDFEKLLKRIYNSSSYRTFDECIDNININDYTRTE